MTAQVGLCQTWWKPLKTGFLALLFTVFIEESVVRRELADIFCYYNTHYDSIASRSAKMAHENAGPLIV